MLATATPSSRDRTATPQRKGGDAAPQATVDRIVPNPLWNAVALGAQAKLAVSMPGDPSEHEADRVADALISGAPAPSIANFTSRSPVARKCAACEAGGAPCPKCEDEEKVQLKTADGGSPPRTVDAGFATGLTGGKPLAGGDRDFFESRLGYDFGDVRIHADSSADASARSIGARAYTLGNHVAFASGEYDPGSSRGRHLIGHELTHVVQQSRAGKSVQRAPSPREEEIARSLTSPGGVTGTLSPPFFSVYNFAINSPDLKAEHEAFLDELADLVVHGAIKNLRIVGHADSTGDDVVNGPLANNRAFAVAVYLQTQQGLSVAGISSKGSSSPVASNSTEAGRNRNRRVDIQFDIPKPKRKRKPKPKPDPDPDPDPKPKPKPKPPTPTDDDDDGPDWPDFDLPCTDHPIICGLIGVGVFCLLNPEICLAPFWPFGWPPGGGGPGGDDGPDDDEPDEPDDEHECGDPELPPTHVDFIPATGDKGNRVEARPLTRCEGNTHGSETRRAPNWPHGWDCVVQSGQSNLWRRLHLLHGPDLHGPGNERRNIIIGDSSINGNMYHSVEEDAIERVERDEVLYYEVEAVHFTGPYPRPYFAERMHMRYGPRDPITGVEGTPFFDDFIDSNVGHQPPNCTTPPPPPPPGPQGPQGPQGNDDETPSIAQCDRAELERRIQQCTDDGERAIRECTPLPGAGWEGVVQGVEYLACLRQVQQRLLECDNQARVDTNCPHEPSRRTPGQRDESFNSTLEICHRLLNSRTFNVTGSGIEVDVNADWVGAGGGAADPAECTMSEYHVSLEQSGVLYDSEISTRDAAVGKPVHLSWTVLPGQYYLTIWTNNENPNCCLKGTISVRLP
jgi:outer membrane protein OmpA-like peptidoglycan-associated protein